MKLIRMSIAVLALVMSLPLLAAAQEAPRQGSAPWEEHYSLDVDTSGFMDRLHTVLTSEEYFGSVPEIRGFAEMASQMGVFDFDRLRMDYSVVDGKMMAHYEERYGEVSPESYLGRMFALQNKPLQTARFVSPEDFVLYAGGTNLPQHVLLWMDEVGKMASQEGGMLSEMMGGDATELAQGLAMVDAFNIDTKVDEILTGEVSLVMFAMPDPGMVMGGGEDFNPGHLELAALIGLKDATQLRELAGMFAPQAGFEPMTGDLGGWTGYYIPELTNGAIMFNDEVMVVSPNIHKALANMNFGGGGLSTEPLQWYFDLNLGKLHSEFTGPLVDGLIGMAPVELGPTQSAAAYLFNVPEPSALGHIRMRSKYEGNASMCDFEMNTALANYLFYYLGVGISGMVHSEMGGH